jgi:hypothetical protein
MTENAPPNGALLFWTEYERGRMKLRSDRSRARNHPSIRLSVQYTAFLVKRHGLRSGVNQPDFTLRHTVRPDAVWEHSAFQQARPPSSIGLAIQNTRTSTDNFDLP